MAAVIHRLRTPRERIRQDQNEALTQALLPSSMIRAQILGWLAL